MESERPLLSSLRSRWELVNYLFTIPGLVIFVILSIWTIATYPIEYPERTDGTIVISVVLGFAFLILWIAVSVNSASRFKIYRDRLEMFDTKVLLWWKRRKTIIPFKDIVGYCDTDSCINIYYENKKIGSYEAYSYQKHVNDISTRKNTRLIESYLKENRKGELKDDKIMSIVISNDNYKLRTYFKKFIWKSLLCAMIVVVTNLVLFQIISFEYGTLAANYTVVTMSFILPIVFIILNDKLVNLKEKKQESEMERSL